MSDAREATSPSREGDIFRGASNPSCVASGKSLISPIASAYGRPPQQFRPSESLGRSQRLTLAAVGAGLLTLLVIATMLQPKAEGYGTHQQLGLPQCTFVVLFGERCPSCGMTTSWAYLVRGQILQAAQANLAGLLLGVLAIVTMVWSSGSALWGRLLGGSPRPSLLAAGGVMIAALALIQWLGRGLPAI